jgi:molybdenum cofactor guanylyltransferase
MPELNTSLNISELINLGAIALAGGKSSRMGRDKALLEINGMPLLQKICEVAQHCGADPIYIITPWQDRYKSITLPDECDFITETEPQSPLTGFALGLSYFSKADLKTDWVLLLACDLPNLKSDALKSWTDELITLPSEAIAYLPKSLNIWEPLCGFYRTSCLESLEAYIQTGEYSFQAWLSQSVVVEIPNVEMQMLFNCNTPDDYQLVENSTEKNSLR